MRTRLAELVDQVSFDQLDMLLVENAQPFQPFTLGAAPALARRVLIGRMRRAIGEGGRHRLFLDSIAIMGCAQTALYRGCPGGHPCHPPDARKLRSKARPGPISAPQEQPRNR